MNFLFFGVLIGTLLLPAGVVSERVRVAFRPIGASTSPRVQDARVLVAVKIRNHAYSLPTFLATLETLRCPNLSKKCDLWIVFDRCSDQSHEMFVNWLANTRTLFDSIIMIDTLNDQATREKHKDLNPLYFSSNLNKRAMIYAQERNFTHIFFLKPDVILTNPDTIQSMVSKNKPIVAPMVTSPSSRNSNFFILHRNEEKFNGAYLSIYERKRLGCFKVHLVTSCYLVSLQDDLVTSILYHTDEPDSIELNDDEQISHAAMSLNVLMHVCNRESYGYIPDENEDENEQDQEIRSESFVYLRSQHLLNGPNKTYNSPLPVTEHKLITTKFKKLKTKLGFDQIYVINLERRQDRRRRIESTLDDLNLSFKIFKAVDGKQIDEEYIKKLGIKPLPGYKDPYNDRPLNYGEIGCFLSHYFVWQDMVKNNFKKVIVLEDDANFAAYFKSTLRYLTNSMENNQISWDLLYLGRKIMRKHSEDEVAVPNVGYKNGHTIYKPSYTHWTIAYALTLDGAKKLLKPNPLVNLVPVDEYLPIMFDKQPNKYWSSFYPERNLEALAVQPSLISPTHYTGDPSHVSDTEESAILEDIQLEASIDPLQASELVGEMRTDL